MKKIPRWLSSFLVTGYYLAVSVVVTYPLVKNMSTHMIGQTGDNLYFVWLIDWFQKALFELHVNPFDIWFLNYPAGWSLAYTEITPAQLALALPFSLLKNPLFGYNMSMLLTFVLSGITMHAWVRHWTGKTGIAMIAGTAYAALPYHLAHFLIGHLNIAGIQWFPLYFWGLLELMTWTGKEKPTRYIWMTGISLGLISLTSMYYVYMTLLVTVVLLIINLWFYKKSFFQANHLQPLILAFAIALPLMLVGLWPYLSLSAAGELGNRDLIVMRSISAAASPLDYFLPSTDHFLWGKWVNQHFNRELWIETTLYIGFVTLILAIIGVWKKPAGNKSKYTVYLLAGILFAFVLSLGLDLVWNRVKVTVPAPDFLQSVFHRDQLPIPLPGYLFFLFVPFYSKLRVFSRFGIFVLLFVIVLMGLGIEKVLKTIKSSSVRAVFLWLVMALVWLEFYPGPFPETCMPPTRSVDTWLAKQPGKGAVIELPIALSEDQEAVFATAVHGKPFTGGFFNAFPPRQYLSIKPVMEAFPDLQSVQLLEELHVEFILLHVDQYPNPDGVIREAEALGLDFVGEFEDIAVLRNKTLP